MNATKLPNLEELDLDPVRALGDGNFREALFRRRCEQAGIDHSELSYDEVKKAVEERIFLPAAARNFGLMPTRRFGITEQWHMITRAYEFFISNQLLKMPESQKRDFIIQEIRRETLAQFLEINKFTATPEQIIAELRELGVEILSVN